MKSLGASYSNEERDSFMAVWRYSGHLMGIPETILVRDYRDALELFRIGALCEPDPQMESVVMANALVHSAPMVAGVTEPDARRKLAEYIFRMSRAMIGSELANNLNYPSNHTFGVLPWFRMQRRYHHFTRRWLPRLARESNFSAFNTLGVPEEILFADEHEAVHLKEVGYACEPRPSTESITLAHAIVNCVPDLMGMEDGPKRKRLIDFLFRTSRALLGDDMADALEYPPQFTLGVLPFVRMQQRYKALRLRMPGASHYDSENFAGLLQRSVYDDIGMSYRMPDALREAESSAW